MIIFNSIKIKNFLSFGNKTTEIKLNTNKITLLKGQNAHGKSTIMEAVYFAYTGKPYRNISKPKLVNNINKKNLVVELELEYSGNNYKIKRGIAPNIFEIYKDKVLVNEDSNVRDYQSQLENMLGITSSVFKNTIMMSSRYYTPFLELKTQEKREFIESIFSIKIFSNMNDLLKRNFSTLKMESKELDIRLETSKENLNILLNINKKQEEENKKQEQNILDEIKKYSNRNNEITKKIDEITTERNKLELQITTLREKIKIDVELAKKLDVTSYRLNKHLEKIKFFSENNTCKTCGQDIDNEFKNRKILEEEKFKKDKEDYISKLNDARNHLKKIQIKINNINNNLIKLIQENNELLNELNNNTTFINNGKKQYNELNKQNFIKQEDIEKKEKEIIKIEKDIFGNEKERKYIKQTIELISEKGIKKYILDKYIPILNISLNQYLKKFNAPYSVLFNSEMEEDICARGYEDLGYSNLSSGEKQRLDTSLLFSFLDLCKKKNSVNTNLLFLDEVLDQSLDQNGIDGVMQIFQELKIKGYSIFVVSHREGVGENFDSVIEVEKKRFTEVNVL